MHTETEAKKLWCPQARSVWAFDDPRNGIFVTANRGQTDDSCNCIASKCMAWRHGGYDGTDASSPAVGYCGLAGKP